MFKKAFFALVVLMCTFNVYSAPVTIIQTFHDVSYYDYGVTSGLGYGKVLDDDWVFKATIDTAATDLSPYPGYLGIYALTSLTLTQESLGLSEVPILNLPYVFFGQNRFGFANNQNLGPPWTEVSYEFGHFGQLDQLSTLLPLLTSPQGLFSDTAFAPQWDGFQLGNGQKIFGWGYANSATVTVVSEPGGFALVLVALGLFLILMQRRNIADLYCRPQLANRRH